MKCPNCGAEMPDGSKFCGRCGQKLEQKAFCTNCGAELLPGMAFCAACGIKVSSASCTIAGSGNPSVPSSELTEKIKPISGGKPLIHIKGGNCIFGNVKLTTGGEVAEFDFYTDYLSISSKFQINALLVGGWLGAAISHAQESKRLSLDIPYSDIADIAYCKAKMDTAKRVTITLKTGDVLRLLIAPINRLMPGSAHLSTEELFNRFIELAAPYLP